MCPDTRWIQFASFSAVFRSHDRGMSGGGCANGGQSNGQPHMNGCSTVKPWNVPTKYFEANREAMQTRAKWLPLIYNATREAYETGVSILRPMCKQPPTDFSLRRLVWPAWIDGVHTDSPVQSIDSLASQPQPSLRAFCLLSVRADYEFPEEDMAYAADMHGNFAQVRPDPLLRVCFGSQTHS